MFVFARFYPIRWLALVNRANAKKFTIVFTWITLLAGSGAQAGTLCYDQPEVGERVCLKSPSTSPGDIFKRNQYGERTDESWPDRTSARVVEYDYSCTFAQVADGNNESAWVHASLLREAELCEDGRGRDPDQKPQPPTAGLPQQEQTEFSCEGFHSCRAALAHYANKDLNTFGYRQARIAMFQRVDARVEQGRRIVQTVYAQKRVPVPSGGVPDANIVNTEHTWPKSKLEKYRRFSQSKCDLYHLFPTLSDINSLRSSMPFKDCDGGDGSKWQICGNGFEPPNAHKGAVARAMFYLAVTYDMEIDASQERVLRAWSREFPPTEAERERGRRITQLQGNRNPFIDHPEWVQYISDF